MKKKITSPDGTITEFEGTAEELATLEKQLREEGSSDKKNKKLLKDAIQKLDEIAREQEKELEKQRQKPGLPQFDPWKINPQIPRQPVLPWEMKPYRPRYGNTDHMLDQPCAIEQYFKDNPDATSVMLYCPCPRCSVRCSTETVITTRHSEPTDFSINVPSVFSSDKPSNNPKYGWLSVTNEASSPEKPRYAINVPFSPGPHFVPTFSVSN